MKEIHFVSGFLGNREEWNELTQALLQVDPSLRFVAHDVIQHHRKNETEEISNNSFYNWANDFLKSITQNEETLELGSSHKKNQGKVTQRMLVGYSLGARLSLHALMTNPSLFSNCVLISGHCGLETEEEKKIREDSDKLWVQKMNELSPQEFFKEWNSQEVFGVNSFVYPKNHSDNWLHEWSSVLLEYSLARQNFLLPEVKKMAFPLVFIAGEKDKKFVQLHEKYASETNYIRSIIIKDCYHRVHLERPLDVRNVILKSFVDFSG